MPEAFQGLPYGTGMQVHYRGKIDLDPHHYNMFFHLDMGFYAWANSKDDDIHVGVGAMGATRSISSVLSQKYLRSICSSLANSDRTPARL